MTRERYESLPLATLKELAKARNMKGVSTLKKSALIDEMLKLDETEKQMQANEKAKEEVRQEMKEKKEESDIEQKPQRVFLNSIRTDMALSAAIIIFRESRMCMWLRHRSGDLD